ncbi:SEL1-like repeat protein [Leisingera caerulea]|uniref:sel1 repeat family protein n=1 Tax=Leisingera caerulea TaxID=506591 RepID=UPI0004012ACB|nr:sel1 repeat family protein [Leisingera caerulea]
MFKNLILLLTFLSAPFAAWADPTKSDIYWAVVRSDSANLVHSGIEIFRFQEQRQFSNELANSACEGNEVAHGKLEAAAALGNATANTALGWLYGKRHCHYFQNNPELVTSLYKRAAEEGYPIAMTNYGIKLLRGEGTAKNHYVGTVYLLNAALSGWGNAGLFLAEHILLGVNAEYDRDVAQALYDEFRYSAYNDELIGSVENLLAQH